MYNQCLVNLELAMMYPILIVSYDINTVSQ